MTRPLTCRIAIVRMGLFAALAAGCPSPDETGVDTPAGCDAASTCLDLPEGWSGPVAASQAVADAPAPSCDPGYGDVAFTAFAGLEAPAADCGCSCGAPTTEVSCPITSTLEQFESHTLNCQIQSPAETFAVHEGCNDVPYFDDVAFRLEIPELDLDGVTCAGAPDVDIPEVVWDAQVVACALPSTASCDDGVCAPQPADADTRVCVWAEGDRTCPAGDFADRQVVYQDVLDDRGCTECTCGDAQGSCSATVELHGGESCTVGGPDSGPEDECLTADTPVRSVELTYDAPAVVCAPNEVEAVGEAIGADAITLCCL